ncbi:MAG: hypothetical protein HUU60_06810 [Armatimonadetes bacterium]|nr:hypothetical protein [Armatimonadota bacterium]
MRALLEKAVRLKQKYFEDNPQSWYHFPSVALDKPALQSVNAIMPWKMKWIYPFWAAVWLIYVASALWLVYGGGSARSPVIASPVGGIQIIVWAAIFVIFRLGHEGQRRGSFARERIARTIGAVSLTRLEPEQIVVGKLVPALITALHLAILIFAFGIVLSLIHLPFLRGLSATVLVSLIAGLGYIQATLIMERFSINGRTVSEAQTLAVFGGLVAYATVAFLWYWIKFHWLEIDNPFSIVWFVDWIGWLCPPVLVAFTAVISPKIGFVMVPVYLFLNYLLFKHCASAVKSSLRKSERVPVSEAAR